MVDLQTEVKVDISFNTQNSVESANLITVSITTSTECLREKVSQFFKLSGKKTHLSPPFFKFFIVKGDRDIHILQHWKEFKTFVKEIHIA